MKNLRQFCAAVTLIIVLTLPAFAGHMECGTAPPPPPSSLTAQGQMQTPVASSEEASGFAVEPVTQIAVNLWQTMLSLF